jgi:hypothetical protein
MNEVIQREHAALHNANNKEIEQVFEHSFFVNNPCASKQINFKVIRQGTALSSS